MNSLPIYQALISDEMDGITAISLVTEGAVEVDFQMFDKQKSLQQFAIQDEEQHLLLGCIMRCDFDIYRNNGSFEYFIRYDKKTIEKMATKMLKDHAFTQIDLQHDGNMLPTGMVELRELFIKDSTKGIIPNGFEEVNDGSLFAVYKVNSDEIWDLCKQGIFNSFSLEGYFNTVEVKANKQQEKNNNTIMNKIKSVLSKILAEFASVKAVDGTELFYEGEELAVGVEVADADGNAIADGEYEVDEKIVVVKDGKVEEIKDKEVEVEEEPETEPEPEVEAEEEVVVEEDKPAAEPEYDAKADVDALKAEIEALKSEIEALKGEIEAIKEQLQEPVVEPVAEEFEKAVEHGKTGIKNVDKAISILSSMK